MHPIKSIKDVLRVYRPSMISAPIVYDSPHSGVIHPPDFRTTATDSQLKTARDAFVDELIIDSSNLGAVVLVADFPRSYIDPNRSEVDFDYNFVENGEIFIIQRREETVLLD